MPKKAKDKNLPAESTSAPSKQVTVIVDPEVLSNLARLKSVYDGGIAEGEQHLLEGDLKLATQYEQIARQAWHDSKKLKGVQALSPGAVRSLSSRIQSAQIRFDADRAQRIQELSSVADYFFREVRQTAGLRLIGRMKFCTGDINLALSMMASANSDLREAMSSEFTDLEQTLQEAKLEHDSRESDKLLSQLKRVMVQDTKAALVILERMTLYREILDLQELRNQVEQNRSVAETYQRVQAEKVATAKAEQEKTEQERLLRDYYYKLVGTRSNRIKFGQILRNLRDAHQQGSDKLLQAIRAVRGVHATLESQIEFFEERLQESIRTAKGFKELEWLQEAKTGEELAVRLQQAYNRSFITWIDERAHGAIQSLIYGHQDVLVLWLLEVLGKKCSKCTEMAFWVCKWIPIEFDYSWDNPSQDELSISKSLSDAFDLAHRESGDICTGKTHSAMHAPWDHQRVTKKKERTNS
jgi:hypothetical protein